MADSSNTTSNTASTSKRPLNPTGFSRRPALKVLTREILQSSSHRDESLQSISGFVRERRIMQAARDAHKRNHRARRLGIAVSECPLPDPLWHRYQSTAVNIHDFDLKGCGKDATLFEFGQEIVESVEAAEIGPDEGIPINKTATLPRSFLLDAIHKAASAHCLHLQSLSNRPTNRSSCLSPAERAKPLEGVSERYKSTVKTLLKVTSKRWRETSEEADAESGSGSGSETEEQEDDTDNLSDSSESSDSDNINIDPKDPDFNAILAKLLDTPSFLDPVPAYEPSDSSSYAADALWSLDTSSLLAFGVLAEEFMSQMIESHLQSNPNVDDRDHESEEDFDSDELS